MLRIGQRYIAWTAFMRASWMADGFWPDAGIRRRFVGHCFGRLELIEKQVPEIERAQLRPRFHAELRHGQEYQEAYQRYETERIAAGDSIDDPHFYDAFLAQHASIASPVGREDKFVVIPGYHFLPRFPLPAVVLFSGLSAFLGAWVLRIRSKRFNRSSPPPDIQVVSLGQCPPHNE